MDFFKFIFVLKYPEVKRINMFDSNFALLAGRLAGEIRVRRRAPGTQSLNA